MITVTHCRKNRISVKPDLQLAILKQIKQKTLHSLEKVQKKPTAFFKKSPNHHNTSSLISIIQSWITKLRKEKNKQTNKKAWITGYREKESLQMILRWRQKKKKRLRQSWYNRNFKVKQNHN